MEASTSEPLNREPFNLTLVLETEPFVQNITPKSVKIYEVSYLFVGIAFVFPIFGCVIHSSIFTFRADLIGTQKLAKVF